MLQRSWYLGVAGAIFLTGRLGLLLNRRSVIRILRSVELRLLAVNLNFMTYSVHLDDRRGQVFALFVLTVAAAEAAVGLAILVVFFRVRGTIGREATRLRQG